MVGFFGAFLNLFWNFGGLFSFARRHAPRLDNRHSPDRLDAGSSIRSAEAYQS